MSEETSKDAASEQPGEQAATQEQNVTTMKTVAPRVPEREAEAPVNTPEGGDFPSRPERKRAYSELRTVDFDQQVSRKPSQDDLREAKTSRQSHRHARDLSKLTVALGKLEKSMKVLGGQRVFHRASEYIMSRLQYFPHA